MVKKSDRASGEEKCCAKIDKLYTEVLHLVTSVEKGSGSELTTRLRNVEAGVEALKEHIRSIPNTNVNENRQREQIASLYRQIKQKDELLKSLASSDTFAIPEGDAESSKSE
ncbi:unnamed protein product [Caenorhabditis auriculariae]|uniref:Mediator complex subunit 9 n=1 Tax=Caenorhabditis auriculariae TaxID=2777116 RepID=A0A8S1HHT2_9PELO|nr:unnamed protein product [Caenorhabditis auriculariae]